MTKILFLVSIMLLSSYLTEQAKLSNDNIMIDKSDIETNTLKENNLSGSASGRPDLCKTYYHDYKLCNEDGEPCDIHSSICINNIHYSKECDSLFFIKHNFTLDNEWTSVGKPSYCRNRTCQAKYTPNVFKSTQMEYGNETFTNRPFAVDNSESISNIITAAVSAGFSTMGRLQRGASIDSSEQYDSERSFGVTYYDSGLAVSYSTSTTNAISSPERSVTCYGVRNQKVFIQERTHMVRLTGNVCVYLRYSETFKKHVFKCNYVDLRMYPVIDKRVFTEMKCNREIIHF